MSRPIGLALAAVLILCAAPAFADRIDGKPLERIDGRPRISADGAPAILFEDRGGLAPIDTCANDDSQGARPRGARNAF
jgi:hypothetical protein